MKKLLVFIAAALLSAPAYADPVMDNVNKTQTIRCGYVSYAPASLKDPNTGTMQGYTVDLLEEAGRRMGVKVDWAYETNWPTIATDLQTNKFDLACVTFWSNPRSALQMRSSDPVFYQPVFFVERADDNRFDGDISKINSPDVTIAVLEGDVPETIIHDLYPNAKIAALPQSAAFSQLFQEVASKRVDVTISAKPDMDEFAANNPGVLKVLTDHPVRLYPSVMLMLPEATQLQNALNATIREMQLDGTVEKIMKKYATGPHDYYLIGWPYSKIEGAK